MADDDDFDAIDAVHAHDCGVRRLHQLTVVGVRDFVCLGRVSASAGSSGSR